jgi:transcription elongation factor Elf1
VAGGIVVVILLPVLLPIALFLHSRDEKRMRALAETFRCLRCGLVLGADALKLADEAWANYVAKLDGGAGDATEPTRDWSKLYRRRIVKLYDAICPHCGAYHSYAAKQRTFILARSEDVPLERRMLR